MIRRHIFYVLVENRSGVLTRVAGLFSARGFNIESLTVAETDNPRVSRMTIVVPGDDNILDQVRKQLGKLIDVHDVHDFSVEDRDIVNRELLLCKVKAERQQRTEIVQIANLFGAKISNVGTDTMILEMAGDEEGIRSFLEILEPIGILEVARGGHVAMARGKINGTQKVLKAI
ncbi:acetolactate synthase small subunit [bacterium]|nr:acetolactate synthase small subunit [bacterium]